MRPIKQLIYIAIISVLILDSKTAVSGMSEGIALCIQSAIPALFPFLVIAPMVNSVLPDFILRWTRPIGKICGIPRGGESIFLLGLLSGYPNGARLITESWEKRQISSHDALRMLGFCNNAGPAFLFGICGAILPLQAMFALFAIHVISAIITAALLPNKSKDRIQLQNTTPITISTAIKSAITAMATICAWILIFRVMQTFIEKYIYKFIGNHVLKILLSALEITNGVLSIDTEQIIGFKFILISALLAWGGLCVAAQTISVTKKLGIGYYFPGKFLQTAISILLSCTMQYAIFDKSECYPLPISLIIIVIFAITLLTVCMHRKKTVAFSKIMMYNTVKTKK